MDITFRPVHNTGRVGAGAGYIAEGLGSLDALVDPVAVQRGIQVG